MKKSFMLRFISLSLSVLVLLSGLSVGIFANEDESEEPLSPSDEQTVEEVPFEFPYLPGDLPLYELKDAVLPLSDVPAVISKAQIAEYDHVNRLYEQEPDAYTVIFQNRDGGKTVYVFDRPVKETKADGSIADMTASAIVSSSKNNTAALMTAMNTTNTATAIKAMQSRLEAYKTALDLQPYNMLEDKLEAQTLTTSGLAADLVSPMQITPNNSTEVMSVSNTYSNLAGEYAIKNLSNGKYIRQQNGAFAMNTSIYVPYSKWVFTYMGAQGYIIESASKTGYVLAYDIYGADTVTLEQYYEGSLMDDYSFYWAIDIDPDGDNNTLIDTEYCHIVATQAGKLLSGNMTLSYNDGSNPVEVRWQFTNNLAYTPLSSVSISNDAISVQPNTTFAPPTISIAPTGASYATSSDFDWISTNTSVVSFNGTAFVVEGESGSSAEIYCKHKYTGKESNRVTVVVGTTALTLIDGRTYVLRQYAVDLASSPALTMTVDSNNVNITTLSLAVFGGQDKNPEAPSTIAANVSWHYSSQAFTITKIEGTNRYRISAILTTRQYNGGNTYVNKYTKPNTLCVTSQGTLDLKEADDGSATAGTPNDADLTQQWTIQNIGAATVFINAAYPQYALKYDDNNNVYLGSSANTTDALWSVTHFGVDTPCIRQTTPYYCGAASALQALYGYGHYTSGNWVSEQHTLWRAMGMTINQSGAPSATDVREALKDELGSNTYMLRSKGSGASNIRNESEMMVRVISSLENGYVPILHSGKTVMHYLPYCGSDYSSSAGHYINIVGYDSYTGKILLSDCHYYEEYYGLHIVTITQMYNALTTLIYCYP